MIVEILTLDSYSACKIERWFNKSLRICLVCVRSFRNFFRLLVFTIRAYALFAAGLVASRFLYHRPFIFMVACGDFPFLCVSARASTFFEAGLVAGSLLYGFPFIIVLTGGDVYDKRYVARLVREHIFHFTRTGMSGLLPLYGSYRLIGGLL